jgi:hypothetical protein
MIDDGGPYPLIRSDEDAQIKITPRFSSNDNELESIRCGYVYQNEHHRMDLSTEFFTRMLEYPGLTCNIKKIASHKALLVSMYVGRVLDFVMYIKIKDYIKAVDYAKEKNGSNDRK